LKIQKVSFIVVILLSSGLLNASIIDIQDKNSQYEQIKHNKKYSISTYINNSAFEDSLKMKTIQNLPNNYEEKISNFVSKLKENFNDVDHEKILDFLAKKTITGEYFDTEDYSSKIGIMQRCYKIALSNEDIEKIRDI